MTSFLAMEHYSPGMVLAVGLLASFALLGFGFSMLRLMRLHLPAPWRQVTAMLVGLQVQGLLVQAAAMLGISSAPVLLGIWGLIDTVFRR